MRLISAGSLVRAQSGPCFCHFRAFLCDRRYASPRTMSEITYKIACERCGGHIEYPSEIAGQSIQCPACQHTIKLPPPPRPPPEPPSAPAFTTATANMIFHVGRDGTELGQFSEQEFRDKISAGEIRPYDHYWTQEMDDWQLVSEYRRLPSSPGPPTLPPLRRMPEKKKGWAETPASIGGACALVAAFAPLVSPAFFFLLSLPLLFAAFVLAIVSLVRGRVTGGICLLIGLFPALIMSFVSLTQREKPVQTLVANAMRVHADVVAIKTQLQLYESMNGFFPTTDQGLQALVTKPQYGPPPPQWYQLFKELPKDPWGSDYIYRSPGTKNPSGYDLFSAGPDRQPDTADDDWGGP